MMETGQAPATMMTHGAGKVRGDGAMIHMPGLGLHLLIGKIGHLIAVRQGNGSGIECDRPAKYRALWNRARPQLP